MSSFKETVFKASAPGSLMLLGEYAVLYNKLALVCAINKRMTVSLKPRQDERIEVLSADYGQWATSLKTLVITPPFQFVSACLYRYRKKLPTGCDIYITSEFSDQIGLGSSAAVTVATLAVLHAWIKDYPTNPLELIAEARSIIREVQTVGSGADVAASVLGGIVAYRATPLTAEKFSFPLPLTVIYSGSKTPTVIAIRRIREKFLATPTLFNSLCQAIHQCTKEGIHALVEKNQARLGAAMNTQQGLMQALGVSTPLLDDLLAQLHTNQAIKGAKISGAGWGDCVIGLGEVESLDLEKNLGQGIQQLKVAITEQGVERS